ncbi:MAG: hypothetical protein KF799_05095 [Bdellovibrionales bacterium]|nr:hypothetical protein [Bdellovibrionales bacterium]
MKVLIALFACLGALPASADILIRPALSYAIDKTESGGSTSSTTRRMIDLGVGHITSAGWTLLALYGTENIATDSTNSDRTSIGVGGGYTSKGDGPYVSAVYFVSNSLASGGSKYEGDGMQFDFGYMFKVSSMGVGLQFSYRMHNYKKHNGTTLTNPYKKTNLDPMFALAYIF